MATVRLFQNNLTVCRDGDQARRLLQPSSQHLTSPSTNIPTAVMGSVGNGSLSQAHARRWQWLAAVGSNPMETTYRQLLSMRLFSKEIQNHLTTLKLLLVPSILWNLGTGINSIFTRNACHRNQISCKDLGQLFDARLHNSPWYYYWESCFFSQFDLQLRHL